MTRRLPFVVPVLLLLLTIVPASAQGAGADAGKPAAPPAEPSPDQKEPGFSDHWDEGWGDQQEVSILSDLDVPAGKVHDGDVVCIGGNVTVAGEVTGDIVVIGGSLDLTGSARGEVVGVGSTLTLGKGATIDGELVNVLGALDNQGGRISGNKVNIPFGLMVPGIKAPFAVVGAILFWCTVVSLVLFFMGIFLFAALVPHRNRILSEEAPVSILWAFLVGLGVYVAIPIVEFLLFCTVVGIPILFCLHFVFLVLKWLGMVGILHYLGSRLGRLFGRDLSLVGAVLLAFALFALIKFVPFFFGGVLGFLLLLGIKFLFWLFLEVPAVGLVFLTRAGSRPRQPSSVAPPSPTIAVPPVAPSPGPSSPS